MGWLRLDLVKILVLALPALALNRFLLGASAPFAEAPWRGAFLLLPLVALCFILWRSLRRDSPVTLGWSFVAFFPVFCILFSLLTAGDLLTGKRRLLAGYGEEAPRSFLGLTRLGDWHYRLALPAPAADDLMVVTFPFEEKRADLRRKLAFLIRQAAAHGARGVAIDYFLEKTTRSDPLLARVLGQAGKAGMPVIFGYRQKMVDGRLERQPLPDTLSALVPEERQGFLNGYQESDGRVRMVPLEMGEDGLGARSFSFRIASVLYGGDLPMPARRLLQYTRPRWDLPLYPFSPQLEWGRLRGRFVLAGPASETDRVQTPFGELQGVEVHAWSAHALRSGQFIHRIDARYSFPLLFVVCYVLTVLYARGVGNRTLVAAAALLTVLVLAGTALAMRLALIWVDVSYPLVAVWLLTAILLGWRALRARRLAAEDRPGSRLPEAAAAVAGEGARPGTSAVYIEAPPEPAAAGVAPGEGFDVFLSHNSREKPLVRELAEALIARGLRPWLDERELAPGRDWQDDLEEIITTVRSSAVIVGAEGLGPWEIPELRASLSEGVRRGLPVIPVLLPGTPSQPTLPLFLTQFTWVDLRQGFSPQTLDRLQWGITGVKPPTLD